MTTTPPINLELTYTGGGRGVRELYSASDLDLHPSTENDQVHGVSVAQPDVEAPQKPESDPWVFHSLQDIVEEYRFVKPYHGLAGHCLFNIGARMEKMWEEIKALGETDTQRLKDLEQDLEQSIIKHGKLLHVRRQLQGCETPHEFILNKFKKEVKENLPRGSAEKFSTDPQDYVCLASTSGLERWLRRILESEYGKYLCAFSKRKTTKRKGSTLEYHSTTALKLVEWSIFVLVITAFSCVPVIIQTLSVGTSRVNSAVCYVVFLFVANILLSATYRHMPTVSLMILAYGALCANNLPKT